ncbi:hypothetical protein BD324DRAFT_652110 [Kockovaella imperatae]|uniref:Phospholipid/glycerol acyltransferase domain-containing protein n=1 Tax=Kockovaella imperatae TaxID=4999 RepID=A0A1Y1UC15_9TREE|nr:hypothetical protein BD324DRAFT_652110 [Kockovaella imperatae]ORX35559.1 hypothetical protein BD324DRAFT_652110 [Kockovaella imperatae]
MEKYSKWRDASTGIQPFLPPVPPSSGSPLALLLNLSSCVHALTRAILLGAVALLYLLLVEGVCLVLVPIPPLFHAASNILTAILCRLALGLMGYWWIDTEMVSSKRGLKGVTQIVNQSPRQGDLILSNWTSYVEVLYLAFRYNPTFLLPVFPPATQAETKFGRSTGTGSANIATTLIRTHPPCLGYLPVSLFELLRRTGDVPPTAATPPPGMYKTLRDARRTERRPVAMFPEGTTGNGRAVLWFGVDVLDDEDIGGDQPGQVYVKAFKHSAPTTFAPTATCSLPQPLYHLLTSLLFTPSPFPSRSLLVRTLHPSASPSSPSFLPSEVLALGQGPSLKYGRGAWREAIEIVLAETGKIRRVRLGWVEKAELIAFWRGKRR